MARHGTMPEIIYQRQAQISEDRVNLALSEGSEASEVNENKEEVEPGENVEEVPEYDSSTDEDEEPDDGDLSIPDLSSKACRGS